MHQKPALSIRIALLLLSLSIASCKKPETASSTTPALKVTTTKLSAATWQSSISGSGSIAPREEVLIGAEISGVRVREVLVDVGQIVKTGQVLMTLDDRNLRVGLAQANAGLKQAQAALKVAQADARRGAVLRQKGLVSQRETDQVEAALLNAEAGLDVARANVMAAELQLSFATVRAPSAGVLSARTVQPGTLVSPGMELFRLIKDGALDWRAELGEHAFGQVKLGDPVELRSGELKAAGRVRALDAGVKAETRTGLVYVELDKDTLMRVGNFAHGSIMRGAMPVQILPISATVQRDGFTYVFVVQDSHVVQTRIETGQQQGAQVQVLSGLQADQIVVTEGGGFLSDGDRIEVINSGKAP